MSVFRSAITGNDGRVDAGYLALYWAMVGWSVSTVVILGGAVVTGWRAHPTDMSALLQSVGIALGAVSGGFATVVGAVGVFRMGDKDRVSSTVTTTSQTTVQSDQPAG